MREEPLRQLLVKLGMSAIERRHDRKADAVWLNHSCPLAPWTHERGSDRRASFGVVVNDEGKSIFKCWACKQKGTTAKLIRLLQQYRQIDYSDLFALAEEGEKGVRRFKEWDDPVVNEPEELIPLDEDMWHGLFDDIRDHAEAKRFMRSRRVLGETCDKLGLSFDPEKRRIVFPVRHTDGKLYGFSGRTVIPGHQPKVLDYAGLPKRSLIMGADRWRPGRKKVIVEGLFAYARMHEIGLEEYADIGALLGSEMTEEKAAILRATDSTIVLMLDPDDAGTMGVFGVWDALDERYKIEDSALSQLWGHVPVIVPEFPFDEMLDEGIEPDVDNLTLDRVLRMIEGRAWRPNTEQAAALAKAGLGRGIGHARRMTW